jgi:tape measure domain-containing protein
MAKDVKFVISASAASAEAELRKLQATGKTVSDRLTGDFQQLGIKSTMAIEQERTAVVNAFNRIKASGVASFQEIKQAEAAMQAKLLELSGDARKVGRDVDGIGNSFADLKGIIATVGIGLMVRDIVQARAELDKMTSALNVSTGNKLQGADSLRFIREEADRLGLSLQTSATDFGKLASSVKGTVVEGNGAREMFTGITEGLSALQLTADQQSSVWAQITQGINKGNLELEDLKIIAEAGIPVFRMLAESMGRTQPEIMKMISNGELLATNVYPKLAASMHKAYGKEAELAAKDTRSELNKLETAIFNLKSQASSGDTIPKMIRKATAATEELSKNLDVAAAGLAVLTGAAALSGIQALVANMSRLAALSSVGTAGLFGAAAAGGYAVGKYIDHKWNISGIVDYEKEMKRAEEADRNLAAAMERKTAAANKVKASQEINIKQQQKLTAALQEYEKTIASVGKAEMEMAKAGFTADLAKQTGGMSNLGGPIQSYLAVVNEAYAKQLELEKAIGQALFRIGAEQKIIAQQNVQTAQVEKAAAASRLDAWQQYYDSLKTMHSATMQTMQKQQADLFQIRMTTADLASQVKAKLLSPMEKYYADMAALDQKQKLAASLGTEEKISMLQSVQQAWSNLTNEIKDGDNTVVSQAQAVATALGKIKSVGAELEAEKANQIATSAANLGNITTAMKAAADQVDEHRRKVMELDNTIANLNRTFALNMDDKASPVIDRIKAALDGIRDKTVTITTNYVSSYGGASGYADIPSYDVGTPFVPKTGPALVHFGERITTAKDNASGNFGGGNTINVGGVNFNIPNVTNQSTADDLVNAAFPKLAAKLDDYQRRKRAA